MAPGSSESNEIAGVPTASTEQTESRKLKKKGYNVAKCGKHAWREANLKVCLWFCQKTWIQMSSLIPTSYAILHQSLNLPEPYFLVYKI